MPCSNCFTESSSRSNGWVWFCCQCHDGPIANWNPTCPSCGHPISVLGTGFSPIGASNSSWTEVQVQQVRNREFSVTMHGGSTEDHCVQMGVNMIENADIDIPDSEDRIGVENVLGYRSTLPEKSKISEYSDYDDSASEGSDRISSFASKLEHSSSDITETSVDGAEHTVSDNFVTQIMNRLHFVFDLKAAVIRCAAGGNNPQLASGAHQGHAANSNHKQGANSSSKRGWTDQDQNQDEDDHDDLNGGQPPKKQKPGSEIDPPRLACLFFKRNRYRCRHRCCFGPGYRDIKHLKEHLKRDHLVYQCPRCKKAFMDSKTLRKHQNNPEPCARHGDRHVFGINEDKWSRVSERAKPGSKEEQWTALYQIIFPYATNIPSPYYDDAELEVDEDDEDGEVLDREQFYNQLRHNLPDRVKQLLVQAYQERLASGTTAELRHLRASISTDDFQQTLDRCIQRALDDIRSLFNSQNHMKSDDVEGGKRALLVDSSSGGVNSPSGSGMYAQNDNSSTAFPHPDEWTVEATISNGFGLEQEVLQEWSLDSFDDLLLDGDLGQDWIESILTCTSGNSTSGFSKTS